MTESQKLHSLPTQHFVNRPYDVIFYPCNHSGVAQYGKEFHPLSVQWDLWWSGWTESSLLNPTCPKSRFEHLEWRFFKSTFVHLVTFYCHVLFLLLLLLYYRLHIFLHFFCCLILHIELPCVSNVLYSKAALLLPNIWVHDHWGASIVLTLEIVNQTRSPEPPAFTRRWVIKNLFADTKMCSVSVPVIAKWCASGTLDRKQPSPSPESSCPASSAVRCSCSARQDTDPAPFQIEFLAETVLSSAAAKRIYCLRTLFGWVMGKPWGGWGGGGVGGVVSRVAARHNNLLKSHLISRNVWHLWHILTFILLCSLSQLRLCRSAGDQMKKKKRKREKSLSAALPSSSY